MKKLKTIITLTLSLSLAFIAVARDGDEIDLSHDCDLLAASPHDEMRSPDVPGVEGFQMQVEQAVAACELAFARNSESMVLQYQLARSYYAQRKFDLSYDLLLPLTELDYAAAKNLMGLIVKRGTPNLPLDYPTAIALFEDGVAVGHSPAANNLAWMYIRGQGVDVSLDTAFELFNRGLVGENPFSHWGLAWLTLSRGYHALTPEDGFAHGLAAAEAGLPSAMGLVGWAYELGIGTPMSHGSAIQWYQNGARVGNEYAINALARMGVESELPFSLQQ